MILREGEEELVGEREGEVLMVRDLEAERG